MSEITLFENALIVTQNPIREILPNACIAIRDEKILAIGDSSEIIKNHGSPDIRIDSRNKVITWED